jgi:hypothetical protein
LYLDIFLLGVQERKRIMKKLFLLLIFMGGELVSAASSYDFLVEHFFDKGKAPLPEKIAPYTLSFWGGRPYIIKTMITTAFSDDPANPNVRSYFSGDPQAIIGQSVEDMLEVLERRNFRLRQLLAPNILRGGGMTKEEIDDLNQILSVYPIMEI